MYKMFGKSGNRGEIRISVALQRPPIVIGALGLKTGQIREAQMLRILHKYLHTSLGELPAYN
jgi:hypothetical protein